MAFDLLFIFLRIPSLWYFQWWLLSQVRQNAGLGHVLIFWR